MFLEYLFIVYLDPSFHFDHYVINIHWLEPKTKLSIGSSFENAILFVCQLGYSLSKVVFIRDFICFFFTLKQFKLH